MPVHGLPPLLREGLLVAVVPPPLKESRWHRVEVVSSEPTSGQLLTLSDVVDRGAAQALVGKVLLARVDDLPDDYARHDVDALLGREVADVGAGALGVISEVLRGPAQDVWVIEGPFGELLMPAVDEVVLELPPEGAVLVRLPAGTLPSTGEV